MTTEAAETDHAGGMISTTRVAIDTQGPKSWVQRSATIPGLEAPFEFGVHETFHDHYGVQPGQFPERPTTNDMFAASLVACLTGTLAYALEARGITLTRDDLDAEATIDMGPVGDHNTWVVRSIAVHFKVSVPEDQRATVERVHGFFHKDCLISQTLVGSRCEVSSTLELV
jgi:organic hydroperoxide reductase OsmC/OhrA